MRRGLGFHNRRSPGTVFSPLSLFTGGVNGAWYDPSDATTLFTTSAGTTPCAEPGAGALVNVGLMLDKSKGGRQALPITGWVKDSGDGVVVVNGGTVTITGATTTTRVDVAAPGWAIGDFADITINGSVGAATGPFVFLGGSPLAVVNGVRTYQQVIASNTLLRVQVSSGSATFDITSRGYVVGNHAIAANDTTARPELSARVNLLTRTEEINDAAWTKVISTVASNSTTAPDGTLTADTLIPNAVTGLPYAQQTLTTVSGVNYTWSIYLKPAGYNWVFLDAFDGSNHRTWFDLSTGTLGTVEAGNTSTISDVGNGWYRCTITRSAGGVSTAYAVAVVSANNALNITGNGTDGIYVWGGDTRATNVGALVPTYQRIADQYTYNAAGFPRYLRFDGVDDYFNVPGSASAMKFLHSAVSSTCAGVYFANSSNPNTSYGFYGTNSGTFSEVGIFTAYDDRSGLGFNDRFRIAIGNVSGSAVVDNAQNNTLAPITPSVVFFNSDPTNATAANRSVLYVNNGTAVAASTASAIASTANSAHQLSIGAVGNGGGPALMNCYGLIIVNATITGGQRTATQNWIAAKMGVTLP